MPHTQYMNLLFTPSNILRVGNIWHIISYRYEIIRTLQQKGTCTEATRNVFKQYASHIILGGFTGEVKFAISPFGLKTTKKSYFDRFGSFNTPPPPVLTNLDPPMMILKNDVTYHKRTHLPSLSVFRRRLTATTLPHLSCQPSWISC